MSAIDNNKIEVERKEIKLSHDFLRLSIDKLTLELSKDKAEGSYYYSWQANIAMAFKDEFCRKYEEGGEKGAVYELEDLDIHEIANDAAKNFLDLLIER
jgi:hypothetical protein